VLFGSTMLRLRSGCLLSLVALFLFANPVTLVSAYEINDAGGGGEGEGEGKVLEAFDSNHDGVLQKHELDAGIDKLKSIFQKIENKIEGGVISDGGGVAGAEEDVSGSGGGSFWKAFTSAVAVILATEIGDKTFFIAAVLSMKHARGAVFLGAIAALVVMTILSTGMGLILPQLVSRTYTHVVGGLLFLYFGAKLWWDSRSMEANQVSDELYEVEEELLNQRPKKKEGEGGGDELDRTYSRADSTASGSSSLSGNDEEQGRSINDSGSDTNSPAVPRKRRPRRKAGGKQHWYTIATQAFTLTFLAEWGDRSQIATIALAAAKNPYGVTVGGCIGHSICTGLAVIGGRMLASSISEKSVSSFGGTIFLLFGIHALFFET